MLNISDEKSLLNAVLKWIKADIPSRKDHLLELLDKIELTQIPTQTLRDVKNDPLFKKTLQSKIERVITESLAKKYDTGLEGFRNQYENEDFGKFRYGCEQGVRKIMNFFLGGFDDAENFFYRLYSQ